MANLMLAQIYMEGVDDIPQDLERAATILAPLVKNAPLSFRHAAKEGLKEIDNIKKEQNKK